MIIKAQSNKSLQMQSATKKMKISNTSCVELKPFAQYQPYQQLSNNFYPHHFHSYPHPHIGNGINSTGVDDARSVLFGAGGDSSEKCYQWDMETQKLIGIMTNSPRYDHDSHYLHSICVVPGGNGQILTGGEDGNLVSLKSTNEVVHMSHTLFRQYFCITFQYLHG